MSDGPSNAVNTLGRQSAAAEVGEKRAVEYDAIGGEKTGGSARFLHRDANGTAPLNSSPHFHSVCCSAHVQARDTTPASGIM